MGSLNHSLLKLPERDGWMSFEEKADFQIHQLFQKLSSDTLDDLEFYSGIDHIIDVVRGMNIRNRREAFEAVITQAIEACFMSRFYECNPYEKYTFWKFDGHKKVPCDFQADEELDGIFSRWIEGRETVRIDGSWDLRAKRQNPLWRNPFYLKELSRPQWLYEIKFLFKETSDDLLDGHLNSKIFLANPQWKIFFDSAAPQRYVLGRIFSSKGVFLGTLMGRILPTLNQSRYLDFAFFPGV